MFFFFSRFWGRNSPFFSPFFFFFEVFLCTLVQNRRPKKKHPTFTRARNSLQHTHNANIEMSVQSSLRATTSLASQTKSLSNQFRKSCSVKASTTTTGRIDATTTALHGKSGRKCMLTGKRANNGYTVSFSHIRNKKMQRANLQVRLRAWFWSRCWLRRASFGRRNSSFFVSA